MALYRVTHIYKLRRTETSLLGLLASFHWPGAIHKISSPVGPRSQSPASVYLPSRAWVSLRDTSLDMLPWVALTGHLSQAATWVSAGNQLQKASAASCVVTQAPERLAVFQILVSSRSVGGQWLHVGSGMRNWHASVCNYMLTCSQRDISILTML